MAVPGLPPSSADSAIVVDVAVLDILLSSAVPLTPCNLVVGQCATLFLPNSDAFRSAWKVTKLVLRGIVEANQVKTRELLPITKLFIVTLLYSEKVQPKRQSRMDCPSNVIYNLLGLTWAVCGAFRTLDCPDRTARTERTFAKWTLPHSSLLLLLPYILLLVPPWPPFPPCRDQGRRSFWTQNLFARSRFSWYSPVTSITALDQLPVLLQNK